MRNIGVFNNTLSSNQEKAPRTEEDCWQKKESICLCAISSCRAVSTSVLAEQLSAIEVGVKKLHLVYAANDNFYGGAGPWSPRGSYATGLAQLGVEMDTEKQRLCRCNDARLTENGNARRALE